MLAEMLHKITSPPIINQQEDSIIWPHDKKGFSVKSMYEFLTAGSIPNHYLKSFIWNPHIPPKICFFSWEASLNKILTLDNLKKRGHQLPNCCYMCSNHEESPSHLLLQCPYARTIWFEIMPLSSWCWTTPRDLLHLAYCWSRPGLSTTGKHIWQFIPAAIIWSIWTERNARAFEGKAKPTNRMVIEIKYMICFWAKHSSTDFHYTTAQSILNWDSLFL
ncbi:Reverse transcriptase zinc-binding domain [Macleaya cordata]|uniref:Reverse transcriptase zinc-binding domain n=1 Tax=Macleaya cordata TaxID=56857 RepID=A0A200R318_MACCD|nr:Reverse transcriptase zinc-binding domain [Macleaya cordata]